MDEFGVLVESTGFKSQSRSTPLSKLKSQPNKPNNQTPPPPHPHPHPHPPSRPLSMHRQDTEGFDFDFDVGFGFNQNTNQSGAGAGAMDLDAFFVGGSAASASAPHDTFGFNSINNSNGLDLLSDFAHPTLKGNSGQSSSSPPSFFESPASASPIDQLEAFAMGSSRNNGTERFDVKISNEAITRVQEKLKHLGDRGNAASHANIKVPRDSKVTPGEKPSVRSHSNEANNTFGWFSKDSRAPKSEIEDPVLDSLFTGRNRINVENPSSQSLRGTKKAPSNTNHVDDFLFFEEPAPPAVEFLEIEGEPEERRRARFNQHLRTKERMAKALSEMNRRDLQAQHEQEERHSLAESMDNNIKRWAAGKVGNLRALLSSLEYVLWPECGWQPVPLTDMITSVSVKKVYHKATLCVHPDKVQQKGATVQQKYIAEKVFDLLKEAWNKFNAEELR